MMIDNNATRLDINLTDLDLENSVWWIPEIDGDHIGDRCTLDNNFGETKERNDTIEEIRNQQDRNRKHHFVKFIGSHSYENKGQWVYKSEKCYRQFLREIECKKLEMKQGKKVKSKSKIPNDYFSPGFEEVFG